MRYYYVVALIAVEAMLQGCAVTKSWTATGGSRSDGTVRLSHEIYEFEVVSTDELQGQAVANARCAAWGYRGAEAFGGTTRQCSQFGGFAGCRAWLVTKEYQCIGDPPARGSVPAPVVAAPVPAPVLAPPPVAIQATPAPAQPTLIVVGQESYQVERMQAVKACNAQPRALLTNKGPGFETYTVTCNNGDSLTVRCEVGACRVLR